MGRLFIGAIRLYQLLLSPLLGANCRFTPSCSAYGVEAIRGRPLSERSLELTQKAGLAVIGLMMAVALFNDLSRLIGS